MSDSGDDPLSKLRGDLTNELAAALNPKLVLEAIRREIEELCAKADIPLGDRQEIGARSARTIFGLSPLVHRLVEWLELNGRAEAGKRLQQLSDDAHDAALKADQRDRPDQRVKNLGALFRARLTDLARHLVWIEKSITAVTASEPAKRRKAGKDDGRRLTPRTAKEQVLDYIKKQPGRKWNGTQRQLLSALETSIGWAPSPATLSRWLRGTGLIVKTTYTGALPRRHREGGTEAVAREEGQPETYDMPGDPD